MADAWGGAWGDAWGDAWGASTAVVTDTLTLDGTVVPVARAGHVQQARDRRGWGRSVHGEGRGGRTSVEGSEQDVVIQIRTPWIDRADAVAIAAIVETPGTHTADGLLMDQVATTVLTRLTDGPEVHSSATSARLTFTMQVV